MSRPADIPHGPASRHPCRSPSALLFLLLIATGCEENATSPTDPSPATASSAATAALAFSQVTGGDVHTCGLTSDQQAYCWGYAETGQLGTGSASGPESCIGAQGPFPCSTRPTAVTGDHRFRQISAGNLYTCAVSTDFRAYCWGSNSFGTLGDGTTTDRLSPVPVGGGLRFRHVDAGLFHTCGVSHPDRRVYCWGDNSFGQLGDGTTTSSLTPVPVFGGRSFRQVSTGNSHTCGVTTSDEAYCWGRDHVGQLGDDVAKADHSRPVPVAGGHQFKLVAAGSNHTCGVTRTKSALCWGSGGLIGDGQSIDRFTPRAVAGGFSFDRVTAGAFHTCGEATGDRAYCWGQNGFGQLGDGGPDVDRLRPVAVAGGLTFVQLSAGNFHTCGVTPSAVAHCWGDDFFGQLGHGNSGFGAESRSPVPVDGS